MKMFHTLIDCSMEISARFCSPTEDDTDVNNIKCKAVQKIIANRVSVQYCCCCLRLRVGSLCYGRNRKYYFYIIVIVRAINCEKMLPAHYDRGLNAADSKRGSAREVLAKCQLIIIVNELNK